jgi:hypothetical protein
MCLLSHSRDSTSTYFHKHWQTWANDENQEEAKKMHENNLTVRVDDDVGKK